MKVLILESEKDQAKTIYKYLKKHTTYKIYQETSSEYKGNEQFDIIIPTGCESTLIYAQKNCGIKIGEMFYSVKNLVTYDKLKTLQIIDSLGVPYPKTYISRDEIKEFPIFYKSLREDGICERGILQNQQNLNKLQSNNVFFQEFISTPGTYSVGFLSNNGKILTSFIQDELISYPKFGGSGVVLKRIDNQRLTDLTEKIVSGLDYSGWGLVEFKYCDKRKDFLFMEVNAKFWASIEFAFMNEPLFLKKLFGIELQNKHNKGVPSVVYLNRMFASGRNEIKQTIPYLWNSKLLLKQNLLKSLFNKVKVGIK